MTVRCGWNLTSPTLKKATIWTKMKASWHQTKLYQVWRLKRSPHTQIQTLGLPLTLCVSWTSKVVQLLEALVYLSVKWKQYMFITKFWEGFSEWCLVYSSARYTVNTWFSEIKYYKSEDKCMCVPPHSCLKSLGNLTMYVCMYKPYRIWIKRFQQIHYMTQVQAP